MLLFSLGSFFVGFALFSHRYRFSFARERKHSRSTCLWVYPRLCESASAFQSCAGFFFAELSGFRHTNERHVPLAIFSSWWVFFSVGAAALFPPVHG